MDIPAAEARLWELGTRQPVSWASDEQRKESLAAILKASGRAQPSSPAASFIMAILQASLPPSEMRRGLGQRKKEIASQVSALCEVSACSQVAATAAL